MARIRAIPRVGLMMASAMACGGTDVFVCSDDGSCGAQGRCEVTGYCSFPAADCPSGRRYGEHAPATVAGQCVDAVDAGTTGPATISDPSIASTIAETGDDPTSSAVATSVEVSTDPITVTSSTDDGASSSEGSAAESSTGRDRITLGPLAIEEDLDDGSMWPDTMGVMGSWLPSGESMPGLAFLGEFPNGAAYFSYFRFHVPTDVPEGAIVVSATFEVGGWTTYQWDGNVDAVRVWAELSGDAPQVGGLTDYPGGAQGRTLTQMSTRWPEGGGLRWNTEGDNTAPDLAAPIQEALDASGGFADGAHLQLWIAADDLGLGGREAGWRDTSGGIDGSARLTLEILLP